MHREVDFECSPYLDKEYDIPMVKDVVNQMISNELKTFAPKDYLTFLPYPKLNFADSPLLQSGTIYIYKYLTINLNVIILNKTLTYIIRIQSCKRKKRNAKT